MKKSHESGSATHIGPESCGAARKGGVEALTDARTHPRPGQMAASGGTWAQSVLRRAPEPKCAVALSVPSGAALPPRAVAVQPEWPRPLGSHAAPYQPLAARTYRLSSLAPAPHGRYHLRQKPDAVVPLVRIRGGVYEQS